MPVSRRDFIHPEDQAALDELRAIPLFTECLQAVMKLLPERLLHGLNMAQKVRLGPEQLPELYEHLPPVCKALGIDEPELYLEMDPRPNAYTYGDRTPFVTITSGLVEALEPDELHAVIAHECGHVVLQHTLYHTMAALLTMAGPAILGPLAVVARPVVLALRYWLRRSELSADRAAAAVMGSTGPVVQGLIRLAGGPKSITSRIDVGKYAEQALEYDKLSESKWDELLQGLVAVGQTHPFLAVRVHELVTWGESDAFQRVVGGVRRAGSESGASAGAASGSNGSTTRGSVAGTDGCPTCGRAVEQAWRFCRHCGAALAARRGSGETSAAGGTTQQEGAR